MGSKYVDGWHNGYVHRSPRVVVSQLERFSTAPHIEGDGITIIEWSSPFDSHDVELTYEEARGVHGALETLLKERGMI
jgi:hypothetical protein